MVSRIQGELKDLKLCCGGEETDYEIIKALPLEMWPND
jgi:hypothetical protein